MGFITDFITSFMENDEILSVDFLSKCGIL